MSEIDGIRERVALDWQTYSSPTIPEMDRRTLLAAYDALAAELASIKAHSKFQADCGRQTSLALIDAGIKSFGFNADGVKELAAERDALRSRLAEVTERRDLWVQEAARKGVLLEQAQAQLAEVEARHQRVMAVIRLFCAKYTPDLLAEFDAAVTDSAAHREDGSHE